jgi:hypothetical protein
LNKIRLNSIKFYLNIKFWTLETFLCISLALLVKFPTVSLYIFLLFFISSPLPAPTQCHDPFFPMRRPSRTAALPLFYIIPFKPNLFFKENNSKIFSKNPFYKIVLTLNLIIFHRVFSIKIILFMSLFFIFYILVYLF